MARPRSEQARAKMLDAAVELVLSDGLAGFTIDEVARRSGVAKTTIYRHFPTRNELLIAALDGLMPVPPKPDTGSLRDDLREYLTGAIPIFADEAIRAVFLEVTAAAIRDSELRALQGALMQGRLGHLRHMVEQGWARGEISPTIDHATAFEAIEGPLIVRSLSRPATLDQLDVDELVEQILVRLKGGAPS